MKNTFNTPYLEVDTLMRVDSGEHTYNHWQGVRPLISIKYASFRLPLGRNQGGGRPSTPIEETYFCMFSSAVPVQSVPSI